MALGWVALKYKAVALGLEMGCVPSSTGIYAICLAAPWGTMGERTDIPECPLWVRPVLITCVILASPRAEGRANQCSLLFKGLSSLRLHGFIQTVTLR